MESQEYFEDVLELFDVYVAMIAKQNEIIAALKEEIVFLRAQLHLPSHIITSPPTPFSVETCAANQESA